ncbi:hypothetical protein [Sporosarcina sp. ITBMC105]
MKNIYRKLYIFSFSGGCVLAVLSVVYYFIWHDQFGVNGALLVELGIAAIAAIGSGFYFRHAFHKLKTADETSTDVFHFEEVTELTLKRVPALIPKIVHVDSSGQPQFMIVPNRNWARPFMVFKLFEKGLIFPVTYTICDMNGSPIATFRIKNTVKQVTLSLWSSEGLLIGTYIQQLAKSVLVNRGMLYGSNGSIWRQLEAKNMTGDIDVTDEQGRMTATYRYGRFPYATHPAFVSTAHHDYVRFGSHISTDEKLAYTMIFFFWLGLEN